MDILDNLTEEELKCFNRHYEPCEFDDECDVCGNPEHGSYAIGYDSYTQEVDSYICGKCAVAGIAARLEFDKNEYEGLDEYMKKLGI